MLRFLKSLPIQLIACLLFGFIFGKIINIDLANILYTISGCIKDLLMLVLPFIIFTYIWAAIVSFGNRGLLLILSTFGLIVIANMVSLMTAYSGGVLLLPSIVEHALPHLPSNMIDSVTNLWSFSSLLPLNTIEPLHGMLLGLTMGIITLGLGYAHSTKTQHLSATLVSLSLMIRDSATLILRKGFIPVLPLYVLGFVIKLARDGHLTALLHGYAHTFLFICAMLLLHLTIWYTIGTGFKRSKLWQALQNMLPAGVMGFTTMSSSATMPVTLDAIAANTNDRSFANFFTPATVNAHLSGDGISITITVMALLLMSGKGIPSFSVFFIFALHYCLVKFSAAGVPGGGVLVILPVAKEYLGLDDTLMTLLQTIYMLQDPLLTSANVMGNGAFALVVHKLMRPFLSKTVEQTEKENPLPLPTRDDNCSKPSLTVF